MKGIHGDIIKSTDHMPTYVFKLGCENDGTFKLPVIVNCVTETRVTLHMNYEGINLKSLRMKTFIIQR